MPSDTDSLSTRARKWCSEGWKRIKDGSITIYNRIRNSGYTREQSKGSFFNEDNGKYGSTGRSSPDKKSKGVIHYIAMDETAQQQFIVYYETFLKDWKTEWHKTEELRGLHGKFLLIASTKSGRTGDILEEAETEWSKKGYLKDGKEYLMVIISSSSKGEEDYSSDAVHKQHKPSFVWDLTNIIYDQYSQFNECCKNCSSCTEIENFLTDKFHTPQS